MQRTRWTMRALVAAVAALVWVGGVQGATADFTYTQTDAATGSGTITGNIDTTLLGGPGVLPFSGAMPSAAVTQLDTGYSVPAGAVGYITTQDDGNPGGTRGVHLGFSGAVTLSAASGGNTYEIDVPLSMVPGDARNYSFSVYDDTGISDVTGSVQFSGWPGDIGAGHRQSNGTHTFVAGSDTYTATSSGTLGGNASGFGFNAGARDDPSGPVFVDDITFGGSLKADTSTWKVNGNPLPAQTTTYAPPPGDWSYLYDGRDAENPAGAALDGTWDHDNGSDQWDGTRIGSGRPGGAQAIWTGDDIYLRIQDTGDPRDHGMADPGSNRKVGFTKDINSLVPTGFEILDHGVTLSFRARLATDGPLDDQHPDGGGGTSPWPAGGEGYIIHDGGKGAFGIHQEGGGDQTISFALALSSDHGSLSQNGLVMNSLNGGSPSGSVDTGEGTNNQLAVSDPTQFHEFWVTIQGDTSGGGTHRVDVYMDGGTTPTSYHVTSGTGEDEGRNYLALMQGATGQIGATDIDFYAFRPGAFAPNTDSIITRAVRGDTANEPPLVWPAALQEDSNSFVDRVHEFNNIPAEVVGADYVMQANDDKENANYTLDVTTDETANLYMFLDNRVRDANEPGLNWMFDGSTVQFKNTGLSVGADADGDGDIDNTYRVFIAPNVPAGTYRLFEQDDGSSRNMYGVAATSAGPWTVLESPINSVARRNGNSNAPEEPVIVFGPTGGLQEDSPAFVDRTHQWNNVPDIVKGLEYVMLANDDKTAGNYELDLELGIRSNVFLMIDDRVGDGDNTDAPSLGGGTMDWVLAMGFQDTGENIGVDENADGSIGQFSSIFLLSSVPAGTITLLEQDDGGSRNMYGIAVQGIPEPATMAMLGLAVAGLGGYVRRRRKR